MPKYIYECLSCKEIFEVRHGMAERVDNCVECGKGEIQKRISDFSLGKTKETNSEKPAGTARGHSPGASSGASNTRRCDWE